MEKGGVPVTLMRVWCMDRDEHEVTGRGTDQRGAEHVRREVNLVGRCDREHRTGRGRFEERGDTRSRTRHEEQPAVLRRK